MDNPKIYVVYTVQLHETQLKVEHHQPISPTPPYLFPTAREISNASPHARLLNVHKCYQFLLYGLVAGGLMHSTVPPRIAVL